MPELRCPFCDTALSEHPAGQCLGAWVLCVKGYSFWERSGEYGQEIWVRAPGKEPGDELHPRDRPAFRAKFSRLVLAGADLSRMVSRVPPIDWAEAGLLLEEMKMAHPTLDALGDEYAIDYDEWVCPRWTRSRVFLGDTGPHAIARAFIAWKESS